MKKYFLAGLLFFLLIPSVFAANNFSSKKNVPAPAGIAKPLTDLPLGEKLVFEVSWMGVNVGYGQIEIPEKTVVRGREAYHIVATARTNDFLSKLYPVEDRVESWVDARTFYSLKFRKTLQEGRYRADEETEFFPETKKGSYYSYKNGTRKEFEIPGPVHDIVSAFYWFRLQEASVGKSVNTTVCSEEKNWAAEIKVIGVTAKVIRGLGAVDTFYVEPKSSLRGVFYDRGRVWVYFTADQKRVPVWVVFKTPFGPVNGVLKVH